MDIPNEDFFKDLKDLGLENYQDEATEEQHEETPRRAADSAIDSFNVNDTTQETEEYAEDAEHAERIEAESEHHFSLSEYRMQAEGYVDLLDLGNNMLLPRLYKSKLLTPQERSRMQTIKRTTDAGQYATLTFEDQQLDKKLAEIQDMIDAIPFTPEEKQKLTEALAKVLQYYGTTANPTTVLVLTLITVEGARILPLLFKK